MLPDPSWADTRTWETDILPNMGPRLGIFYFRQKSYPSYKYDMGLDRNFYPQKPMLGDEDWQHIIDYYTSISPDTMPSLQKRPYAIKKNMSQFTSVIPKFQYPVPTTTYVKIDTSNPATPIIICDAKKQVVYRFDKNLVPFDSVQTKGPVVHIDINNRKWLTTNIGILNPNNGKYGAAGYVNILPNNKMQPDTQALFNNLERPVEIIASDLNNDKREDYIVCEFGFLQGELCWMENMGNRQFTKHVLRPYPGPIKVYINDYNHDGLPDIWALFTQGEEGIFLFTNLGNGQFSEREVLRFPPIYGSSYFEFDDFNKDGYPDILYTCGDNADYSRVLKPYHGVYIFLNDGKYNFTQKYFFPINGCYKAIARDFDNDGDLDIATISYFADYEHQPEEGFVYLENKGNYDFVPYSLPEGQLGRWLTMDAGDFDGDGKTDLLLGNFSVAPSFIKSKTDWQHAPPFIILKNMGKNN